MNENLNIDVKKLRPITRLIYTIGELPTSYLMSMTYEEQLIWLCNYLTQTVIPTINNNAEAVEEIQKLVDELKEYIENLDLQDEVDTKLDEMVEDGTLAEIINQEIFNELNEQVEQNTKDISMLPLKITPNVRRLGRFIIPYGTDIISTETAVTNYNLQGSCLTSSSTMIMMLINNDDTSATIKEFNFKTGQVLRETIVNYAGHGNGLCKIGDYLYIATYDNLSGTTIKKVRYDDLSLVQTFTFDFPVKTVYQDETTDKVYIANDYSIYEWQIDTLTTTKLFDWNIPNFEINVDGTVQTIVVYKDIIYLLGCYNSINNIVIFILEKDGSLYNTYDLGSNNLSSYYGEGQAIMQYGDIFYMTSVFRLGSTIYNDYQINNVYTFNPFREVHKNNYLSYLSSSTVRQINSNSTSFFVDGTNTYPYKYYFEYALENNLTNQNLVGVISGGRQPLLRARNEKASYNVNGITIEGVDIVNAELILTGSNNPVIDTPSRRTTHTEVMIGKGGRLSILNFIIGNSTDNKNDYSIFCNLASILEYDNLTMYHNIPIYNVGGIVQKSSNIEKLETFNNGRVDPQVIFIQHAGAESYVSSLSVGNKAHKIMVASNRKYLQFNLRCGNNEMTAVSDGNTDLTSFTFTRIFPISYLNEIYHVSITMVYDPTNKKFTVTFGDVYDSTGTSANKTVLGYCSAGLLMIV